MEKIPIIITNYNLVTWPKRMIEVLKTWDNVGEIIIFDNCSTYEPLLEWYQSKPCEIIFSDYNRGHSGVWDRNIPWERNFTYYVVTDPDMGLDEVPKDALNVLIDKMEIHKEFDRIGLSILDFADPTPNVPHFYRMQHFYHEFWDPTKREDGLLKGHIIDTTFGMYHINRNKSGSSCSLDFPYSVRHLPWQITNDQLMDLENFNPEYFYYLTHAGYSSSYKRESGFENLYNSKKLS